MTPGYGAWRNRYPRSRSLSGPADDEPIFPTGGRPGFRAVGSVVHLTLERLSAGVLPDEAVDRRHTGSWWRRELGCPAAVGRDAMESALQRAAGSLSNVLADERGRWLLSTEREEAASELAISRLQPDGSLADFVIDRTYIEDKRALGC